jgi:histidinol-phosphate phosphatase family protein
VERRPAEARLPKTALSRMKQLLILAGGKGTRLKDRLGDLPKPMIPVGGKPLLEHQVELTKRYGLSDIIIFACYRPDLIQRHLGDGSRWGLNISYVIEKEPLGTAGAVLAGYEALDENFLVIYGDTMVNVDLERIGQRHRERAADATLLLHPNDHPLDSDLVEANGDGWISAFHNRPHPQDCYFQNLVNAGLYVIRKSALETFQPSPGQPPTLLDFGKDLFPAMLKQDFKLLAYASAEYIKDIGTPQRYDRICAEYAAGLVQSSSLETPQPAVFLDRDGTLNKEIDGVTSPEKLDLIPGVAQAIHQLNHRGFRVIVVSNQPIVAKGFCTEADIQAVHNKLETLLGREHAFVDRIYYCPHHPDKGFAGERPELKMDCACRKPHPGMIRKAVDELNIDLRTSWLIGDTTRDVQTAKNAGLKSILLQTGYGGRDGKYAAQPDFTFDTLNQAVEFILQSKDHG